MEKRKYIFLLLFLFVALNNTLYLRYLLLTEASSLSFTVPKMLI